MYYQDLLSKHHALASSTVRKYGNIKRIFEGRDKSTDTFWESVQYLGHREMDRLSSRAHKLKERFSEYGCFSLNPVKGASLEKLSPIRMISKPPFEKGANYLPEGTEIKGFIFSSDGSFKAFGRTYKIRTGGIADWFLTIGPTIIDKKIKNSLIEILERPHLYQRPGNWAVTHYVCPSPEFLNETYPDEYTGEILSRISPAPLKDENYRKQRKEIWGEMMRILEKNQ
ncbi:hypothetical protein GOV13_04480 [Candidatus Pacearchaeota archaeon]|nr:hypothetical protein [Candidatus Pacearchaeota archaeon]